jgi:transposase
VVVAVRTKGLRVLSYGERLEALRMLADRREELSRQRVHARTGLRPIRFSVPPARGSR